MLVVISHYIGKEFDFGGECGVSFFFILSGFVLSYAYSDKISNGTFNNKSLFARQFKKIYPLHIATFLIMFILDLKLERYYDIYVIIPNVLLLQSWFPDDSFYFVANGASWFLCDILFFYLIFPNVNKFILNNNTRRITIYLTVIFLLYIWLIISIPDSLINPILYANPLTRLLDFSIGIVVYKIYISEKCMKFGNNMMTYSPLKVSIIEITLILSIVAIAIAYPMIPQRVRTVSLFWMIIPVFLLFFAISDKSNGVLSLLLQNKSMVWLGNISFDIYIIHMPVLRIFNSILSKTGLLENRTIPHFIIFSIILIVLSYYTHIIMNNTKRKRILKR